MNAPIAPICADSSFMPRTASYSSFGNKFTLLWASISGNYKDYNYKEIVSPVFLNSQYPILKWSLSLVLDPNERDLSVFLCCEASNVSEVKAKFRFCLRDRRYNRGFDSPEMTEYCIFTSGRKASYGFRKLCDVSTVQAGKCEIRCDIEVHPDDMSIIGQDIGEPAKVPDSTLLDDMVSAFATPKYTDFIIINEGVSFPVHKVILSARSPVFAAMFEYDTKEQRENRVNIEDMTPEALREMLRFVYTDKVMDIGAVAKDLLAPAEKYALGRLKTMCENALSRNLDNENAAETLILADLHGANGLKTRAIDFIGHHAINVLDTPGFKLMMTSHPHLMAEIIRALAKKN